MSWFLGTLLVGISLTLFVREWIAFHQRRAHPDELTGTDAPTFVRRAAVSLLMLGFVALVANQPAVLVESVPATTKLAYFGLYLLSIAAIFIFVYLDFRHGVAMARRAAALLDLQQRAAIEALLHAVRESRDESQAADAEPRAAADPDAPSASPKPPESAP